MKFQNASRMKLRFQTTKGILTVEDLWDLSKSQLTALIRALKSKIKVEEVEDLAFLELNTKQVDEVDQLRFDIAKEIYIIKRDEDIKALYERDIKLHNQEILELINKKEKEAKAELSIEELRKSLK